MRAPFEVTAGPRPIVSTVLHAGHDVRPALAGLMALDDATRRREEDPYTDRLIRGLGTQLVVHRSRFEVDLNRPREHAVYLTPDDAWGLDVWNGELPESQVRDSLAIYDDFYQELATQLDRVTAVDACLLVDVHSYNHRRSGPSAAPGSITDNPEINVGTGSLDRARWGPLVERFCRSLADQVVGDHQLDVRENVRFEGGHLSRWVATLYPDRVCVLAVEFKKTFMDEWTGVTDDNHIEQLAIALRTAVEQTAAAMIRESR